MVAVVSTPALQTREERKEAAPKAAHFLHKHAQGYKRSGSLEFNLFNTVLSQAAKAKKE